MNFIRPNQTITAAVAFVPVMFPEGYTGSMTHVTRLHQNKEAPPTNAGVGGAYMIMGGSQREFVAG